MKGEIKTKTKTNPMPPRLRQCSSSASVPSRQIHSNSQVPIQLGQDRYRLESLHKRVRIDLHAREALLHRVQREIALLESEQRRINTSGAIDVDEMFHDGAQDDLDYDMNNLIWDLDEEDEDEDEDGDDDDDDDEQGDEFKVGRFSANEPQDRPGRGNADDIVEVDGREEEMREAAVEGSAEEEGEGYRL
uniref:Uncharacterized protein n=1 Tax=Compsopogon caeruleus TaxID=31354 RepID=A0A7S1XD91_9RHOD|mmetsp:Transcript_16950/g.35168  ORF Transcript_16950/g.35168 Transcript_16950/m.35168 type:complete len:190 (+) Transcript_16950:1204-1773(+)